MEKVRGNLIETLPASVQCSLVSREVSLLKQYFVLTKKISFRNLQTILSGSLVLRSPERVPIREIKDQDEPVPLMSIVVMVDSLADFDHVWWSLEEKRTLSIKE